MLTFEILVTIGNKARDFSGCYPLSDGRNRHSWCVPLLSEKDRFPSIKYPNILARGNLPHLFCLKNTPFYPPFLLKIGDKALRTREASGC